jgi:hypothetical protein
MAAAAAAACVVASCCCCCLVRVSAWESAVVGDWSAVSGWAGAVVGKSSLMASVYLQVEGAASRDGEGTVQQSCCCSSHSQHDICALASGGKWAVQDAPCTKKLHMTIN